ncbi:2Fe-2S iron-sulfur cluster-binding protein [Methanosphaera sp. ISO3-F5]|uniref:succinate dehydrogenase/fumarate reductase iron-sulfur subunit n=1 Tax=Methanosphaera sp. ISO3-F5 TaxID=1452353 RepID=UPI002B25687B|nr:2Fe-2S iron-sulfur cluster-binding protein [Methanosphaera sp. ISO3-F5]WQH63643.1 2Fe-2S iron-sulfur cluster-binding protein [Methanosphaera sp. ISO3-F5]
MQTLKVIIKTQENGKEKIKEYEYKEELHITVTTLLEKINHTYDTKIHYSSSCQQGICGSCTMLINGWPKLACKTFIDELIMTKHFQKITIEPLTKFPIIKDLIVDRNIIHKNMKKAQQWLENEAKINPNNIQFEYEVSQCLLCGCCLEVCPNYNGENDFMGIILPVTSSKITSQETNKEKQEKHKQIYKKHFQKHCVKALVCEDICPMKIPTQKAITKMNNLLDNYKSIKKQEK